MNIYKEKSKEILSAIKEADNILLHLHPSPDPDSVGSALAVYHALRSMNKKVTVIGGDSSLPESSSFLPGFAEIEAESFFTVDTSAYDLFIVLDSGSKEMISKHGEITFPASMKTVVIDHHISNQGYGDINLVDPEAPATAQILFELFSLWGVEITPDMAICLFVALYGDTGGFRYPKTTKRTFTIAGELVDIYPDFPAVLALMNSQNTPGQLSYRALAWSKIEILGQGKMAMVAIPYADIAEHNFSEADLDGAQIPNNLISVRDWVVGVSLVEKKPGQIFMSLRSRDSHIDVSKVATLLGGGGHAGAAGGLLREEFSLSKEKLVLNFKKLYPDLF